MFTITKTPMTDLNNPDSEVCVATTYGSYHTGIMHKIQPRRWDYRDLKWFITLRGCQTLIHEATLYNVSIPEKDLRACIIGPQYDEHQEQIKEAVRARLSNTKPWYPYEFKVKPYSHQIEAFNVGVKHMWLLIGDEQGLGKTASSAWIADYRYQQGYIHKCLIVCGVNSVKYNWMDEIGKYTNQKAVIFDQSTKEAKLKAIDKWAHDDTLFGIINIEALRAPVKFDKRTRYKYLSGRMKITDLPVNPITAKLCDIADMTIVDEIHKAKSPISLQGIALRQLDTEYRIGLSGTPLTKDPTDLWNILSWLGIEHRTYWAFKDHFCYLDDDHHSKPVAYKNMDELRREVSSIMLRRKKDEVLDLPDKIYTNEFVEMTRDQRRLYHQERDDILQVVDSMPKIKNPLVMLLNLRQIANGMKTPVTQNPKLERVKSMLGDDVIPNGQKAIVFTVWAEEAKIYRDALSEFNPGFIIGETEDKQRQEEVNRFQNDPDCKVIIGTIGAMGTGLTLTAASYVFFVSKSWIEMDNVQAEDRAHRIGTKSNVVIVSMLTKDSVDEKIEETLSLKANVFSSIIEGNPATGKYIGEESNKAFIKKMLNAE